MFHTAGYVPTTATKRATPYMAHVLQKWPEMTGKCPNMTHKMGPTEPKGDNKYAHSGLWALSRQATL